MSDSAEVNAAAAPDAPGGVPCETVRPILSAMVDGEASPEERSLAGAHLPACSPCQSHYAFLRLTKDVLERTPAEFPSRALSERIAAATYARPTFADRLREFLRPAPARLALGTALAAGISVWLYHGCPSPSPCPLGPSGGSAAPVARTEDGAAGAPATGSAAPATKTLPPLSRPPRPLRATTPRPPSAPATPATPPPLLQRRRSPAA
jgi:hypothetical protein